MDSAKKEVEKYVAGLPDSQGCAKAGSVLVYGAHTVPQGNEIKLGTDQLPGYGVGGILQHQ